MARITHPHKTKLTFSPIPRRPRARAYACLVREPRDVPVIEGTPSVGDPHGGNRRVLGEYSHVGPQLAS